MENASKEPFLSLTASCDDILNYRRYQRYLIDAAIPNLGHDQNSICVIYKYRLIFAATVPVLLPVRSASGSFFGLTPTTFNTPLLPIKEAHWRGLFFYDRLVERYG
jgi:hypothetical protein